MQRRHLEDPLPVTQLVAGHLENDRQRLDHENPADAHQQDLLLNKDGDHAHAAAQRKRPYIAHEDLGRVRVVPQKAQRSARHGAAEYRQLARSGQPHQVQIFCELSMAAGVRQHRHGPGGDDHQPDREAIQSIGQVHGVGTANQDEGDKQEEEDKRERVGERVAKEGVDDKTGLEALEERHVHRRRVAPVRPQYQQKHAHRQRHHALRRELAPAGDAEVLVFANLGVVVPKPDRAEGHDAEDRDPDIGVGEVRPQQRGHHNGDDDQHAAHGGRAGLLLVRARAFLADHLADLELAQLRNQPRPQKQAQKQRRHAGECRPKRDEPEYAERAEVVIELFV